MASALDFMAHLWLTRFLKARGLDRPDGRPLYAYRCTEAERDELVRLLRGADLCAEEGRKVGAAFTLLAAEMFRTRHGGGPWRWATVLEPLSLQGTTDLCADPIRCGLRHWGRPLRAGHGHHQYLFSAVLEGGFPAPLIAREGGPLRDWLFRLQGLADRHGMDAGEAADAAAEQAGHLPESLRRPELFYLAGELVCAVRALRSRLGPVSPESDPLPLMQAADPDWRAALPLEIEDEPARALLRGLIQAHPSAPSEAEGFCRRILVPADGGWAPALRLEGAGTFATARLPTAIRDLLDSSVMRARLVAAGPLAGFDAELGAIERRDEGWAFRSRRGEAATLPFALDRAVSLALRVDGRTSAPFLVPGGAPILDEVLVFHEGEGGLAFAGGGSRSTQAESLFVAFDPNTAKVDLDPGGSLTEAGPVAGTRLRLHALSGTLRLLTASGVTRLATRAEREAGRAVMLLPRPVPVAGGPEPASLGMPGLAYVDGLHVAHRDVRWRPVGVGGPWTPLEQAEPLGHVQIVVARGEEIVDRLRATVLPAEVSMEVRRRDERGGLIRLHRLGARQVSPERRDGLQVEARPEGDSVLLAVEAAPGVTEFEVRLLFPNGAQAWLRLPVPRRGVAFVDAAGRPLRHGAGCRVDNLAGLRLRGEEGGYLTATLRAGDARGLDLTQRMQDGASLAALAPDLRALLAETGDLDAVIVVEASRARLELRRFDHELRPGPGGLRAGAPSSLPADAAVTVTAYSLAGEAGERELWAGPAAALADQVFASPDPARPWMVWAEFAGRALSRPALLPAEAELAESDPFSRCATLARRDERRAAMAAHLGAVAADPGHPDWGRLRAALGHLQGRVPLAALDWFTVLAGSHPALAALAAGAETEAALARILDIDEELPLAWELVPARCWAEAFGEARAALARLLGPAADLADALVLDRLRNLARLRPALQGVAEKLALLCGGGLGVERAAAGQNSVIHDMQGLITRNDGRRWPRLDALRPHIPSDPRVLRFDDAAHPTLAAPFLAASACAGTVYGPDVLRCLRIARRYDRAYFDATFAAVLDERLRPPAPARRAG